MKKTLIYLMVLVLTTTIGNAVPAAAQTTDNTATTRVDDDNDADDDGDNGRWGLAGLLGLLGLLGLRKRDDHTHTVRTTANTNR